MLAPGGIDDETLTHTIKNSLTPNLGKCSLMKTKAQSPTPKQETLWKTSKKK